MSGDSVSPILLSNECSFVPMSSRKESEARSLTSAWPG